MRLGSLTIYYNNEQGFIITPYTTVQGSGMETQINPVQLLKANIECNELGNAIFDNLKKSRVAEPVTHEQKEAIKFWHISGIKGFRAFSKKFSCVDVTEETKHISIMKMIREKNGGYSYPKADFKMQFSVSTYDLGKKIFELLDESDINISEDTLSFETAHSNVVSYNVLPDDFLDIGDGRTDAYQIYTHEDNDSTYIGFFIDSGYADFTETAIKRKWQGWNGDLSDFKFEVSKNGQIKISAKTKNKIIKSYLFKDNDNTLEVMYEIDLSDKKEEIENVFEQLISSIKITPKK